MVLLYQSVCFLDFLTFNLDCRLVAYHNHFWSMEELLQIVVPPLDFLVGALGKVVDYLDKLQLVDIQAVVEGILLVVVVVALVVDGTMVVVVVGAVPVVSVLHRFEELFLFGVLHRDRKDSKNSIHNKHQSQIGLLQL